MLSTAGQYWELCKDTQLEFKRVSAATQCCWGIACDNQVYVYVCASDVPIRRREEAYENQVGSRVFGLLSWLVCWEIKPPHPTPGQFPNLSSYLKSEWYRIQGLWDQSACCVFTKAGWPDLQKDGLQAFPRGPGWSHALHCPPLGALWLARSLPFGAACWLM